MGSRAGLHWFSLPVADLPDVLQRTNAWRANDREGRSTCEVSPATHEMAFLHIMHMVSTKARKSEVSSYLHWGSCWQVLSQAAAAHLQAAGERRSAAVMRFQGDDDIGVLISWALLAGAAVPWGLRAAAALHTFDLLGRGA